MSNLATASDFAADYSEAVTAANRAVLAYPEHPRSYLLLATALGQIGQTADARQAFAALVKASLSYVAFKTGRRSLYVRPEDHEHLLHG